LSMADPDLQFVICTAYSDYSWEDMIAKLGQTDRVVILKKPFDRVEVLQLASSLSRKWELVRVSKATMARLQMTVEARTSQIMQEQEKFRAFFENCPEGIFQSTPDGQFLSANPALATILGYTSPDELMREVTDIGAQIYVDPASRREFMRRVDAEGVIRDFEMEIRCRDGSRKWTRVTALRIGAPGSNVVYYEGFLVDVSSQKREQAERNLMEVQLRQAQKLESVGQLAAGIAHEINTPIQYVGDNLRFVADAFSDLNRLIEAHRTIAEVARAHPPAAEAIAAAEAVSQEIDQPFLNTEIPKALQQSLEGVSRVAAIVSAMKEFSHPGTAEKVLTDVNKAIQTTITVARNEWKYVAEVVTDLDPALPAVPCLPGEFNQVILNLLVNAAHTIADAIKGRAGAKGTIRITTRQVGANVEIRVSDTGLGIPETIRHRIFEPFFTTKEVGKGTGQGLALARATIVTKHGGDLTFDSRMGQGTTFIILLPIQPASPPAKRKEAP